MKKPIISLTSDFGVQTQGVGIMEAVALQINPEAKVIHLMHGLPDFNLHCAARTMEAVTYMPIGFHVCVVDPGVGTKRKPIIIETGRGDFLIGPDNGVLIPATRFLGGIKKAVEITNEKYMRKPVSPVFHGRDIFTPAAAYLSKGIKINGFGKEISPKNLARAPYEEAKAEGNKINAKVISINKFGSIHLNITHAEWDKFNIKLNSFVALNLGNKSLNLPHSATFGDVANGEPLIFKDDYGKMEIALNMGNFSKKYSVSIGDECTIRKVAR
ncbi:SAM-dependent chlorinase/fluorinase [Candidatus Woesearchaeota archaeon]|nr:SAM-dependent chlorinase/fluorinase [Candidatus Woesearchaeota archaeon]